MEVVAKHVCSCHGVQVSKGTRGNCRSSTDRGTFTHDQLVFWSGGVVDGVVGLDKLAWWYSRIRPDRVSRWRRQYTAWGGQLSIAQWRGIMIAMRLVIGGPSASTMMGQRTT